MLLTKQYKTSNYLNNYRTNMKHVSSSPFFVVLGVYFMIFLSTNLMNSTLFSSLFLSQIILILFFLVTWFFFYFIFSRGFNWLSYLFNRDDAYINKEISNFGYIKLDLIFFWGFVLFLISEVLIFAGLFGSLFFNMICPTIFLGDRWPPKNIPLVIWYKIPLVNSMLLIFSGIIITFYHHSFGHNFSKKKELKINNYFN